ncbi:MAG: hypothetical protein ACRD1B_01390 [Thermoanaerobaculia bacterium]
MTTGPNRLVLLLLAVALFLLPVAGVEAQEDKWSFVLTPQVWFANIPKSGFAAANNVGGAVFNGSLQNQGPFLPGQYAVVPSSNLDSSGADPTSVFFPQWGAQLAAQHGRWTFGLAAQYVSFETSNDFFVSDRLFTNSLGSSFFNQLLLGQKLYTEVINTDRIDVDLTGTYFFPDVIKDLLDVTAGLGFKWIRASGHRTLTNVNAKLFIAGGAGVPNVNYILKSCGDPNAFESTTNRVGSPNIDPGNCQRNRASFLDQHYGATFPTTFNVHLTRDGKWLLPVTMTPFLGYEERTDQVLGPDNAFAYGGTFDAGVRYVFDNGVAIYAGYRGQAIQGINLFFAQGPLVNMSVRFGGK